MSTTKLQGSKWQLSAILISIVEDQNSPFDTDLSYLHSDFNIFYILYRKPSVFYILLSYYDSKLKWNEKGQRWAAQKKIKLKEKYTKGNDKW